MSESRPPKGVVPHYVRNAERVEELCEAIMRQTEGEWNHNQIKLWCKEILLINETDRMLRYEEKQKVWSEDKNGMLREMD